ncbi:MAG: UbiA family prenyltransferase [Candidatus Rokuibacteriota bacterium]
MSQLLPVPSHHPVQPTPPSVPLAVDLDGTLLRTDVFWESLVALLRRNPLLLALLPYWALRGRAALKHEVARRVSLDVARLPYHEELLAFLREEHRGGRPLALTTAADGSIARRIADHLALFSRVFASDGRVNVKGDGKLEALRDAYGDRGFDYAGNARADLPVWRGARAAILVGVSGALSRRVRRVSLVTHEFTGRGRRMGAALRALRPRHWVKGLLVFVPLVTAHRLTDLAAMRDAALAFAAFALVASSVYLLNDLLDLESDRHHPQKRFRPLASGQLPIPTAMAIIPVLVTAAVLISAFLPPQFWALLGAYAVASTLYSFVAKTLVLVDIVLLALLYGVRVLAGGAATSILISPWLVAFSGFIFLSLAFVKRVSELRGLRENGRKAARGRGYLADDLEQLASFGAASGNVAVLVFALYINSPEVRLLYASPGILWLATPLLLYWISRVWLLAHRGQIPEDPVLWVIRDPVSYLVGLAVVLIMVLAT